MTAQRNHVALGLQYARDAASGREPACKWVRLACQRHLSDLERQRTPGFPYRFDEEHGGRVCRFVEKLKHTKGPLTGQPIQLERMPPGYRVAAGGGPINNHAGAFIKSVGNGILIDNSSQGNAPFVTHLTNDGTINAAAGYGVRIISALDDTIDNAGTIVGGNGTAIQFGSGNNTLKIRNGSVITGISTGGAGTDTFSLDARHDPVSWNTIANLHAGDAAIIFGILALAWPGLAGFALVILFGAYAFVDGVFAIISAIRAAETHERWVALALEGIVGLVIAAIVFFAPGAAAFGLYITIAIWAVVTGIFEIVAAIELRKVMPNDWLLLLAGICSIVFGILMVAFPLAGALALLWLIGAYAIVFGVILLAFALRLRTRALAI